MGCWGITAFESDAGLDAAGFIRDHLPEDGRLELEKLIGALRQDSWNAPSDVTDGESHTSPMALAEVVVKFLDRDLDGLDYDGDWAAQDKKFNTITSFTASRDSVRWLRDYLSDTLKYAVKNAEKGHKWGGWFQKKDWIDWQNHMAVLIGRLDGVLAGDGSTLELYSGAAQAAAYMPEQAQTGNSGLCMK